MKSPFYCKITNILNQKANKNIRKNILMNFFSVTHYVYEIRFVLKDFNISKISCMCESNNSLKEG